jgi:hypothetical protein
MKILNHVRTIGPAIWLYLLYGNNAEVLPGDRIWAPVCDLHALRDRDAAEVLKVPVHTITRWRYRLERIGVVRTVACRGGGLKTWLRCSDLPSDEPIRPIQPENWPAMQTEVVQ